ncbi:2-oxoglutarate ferredoxin oxidoreductase, alpha subunit [Deferribacter desulfuricans SSM1]|uniref:2-oxoglutarate ferredoxin oxidoreductase, alpha subunit n=1 Tax=Deferribacter desulfuricans (strain DSM 14783 / JCM 11476 / NBRC 101012 / SSM1) TaxID=639282 RepID=D3PCS2_DEFDS|nr:2-oxoacid:acceptor oxidoreductase subunit alpha [Deferribacter desulfuricans]BAI80395.1 2-oxoglutarate ferredoxin oxidoreductase, alpha subunit [Deferribacter desulfuricans SSM1]
MAKNVQFMMGNHAVAEGALYAGCRFYGGYPITPSTEIAERMAERLPQVGGRFIQMEDEIAAMASVIGASLAGAKALTATSGPGFSLKQENLGFASLCEIPVVIVDVMRGGPSTGMPTGPSQSDIMQAKWGTHGDHPIIAVTPASVQEQFNETVRAFNLAEKYRCPVVVLTDAIIGQMMESLVIPEPGELEVIDRIKDPGVPPEEYLPYDMEKDINPMPPFGAGYRWHVTGLHHDETGFPTNDPVLHTKNTVRIIEKINKNYDDIVKVEEFYTDDADILVFAIGVNARSAKAAVLEAREKGIKAGLLRPLTIWPFPDKHLDKIISANNIKGIVVPEMNLGQMTLEVERVAKGRCEVEGLYSLMLDPILPSEILEKIRRFA